MLYFREVIRRLQDNVMINCSVVMYDIYILIRDLYERES